MPVITEADHATHACPWQEFRPCIGAKCMAWAWASPEFETRDTDNIDRSKGQNEERPTGEIPQRPDGDGWEPEGACVEIGYHKSSTRKAEFGPGRRQRWRRKLERQRGHCARVGHTNCQYGPW